MLPGPCLRGLTTIVGFKEKAGRNAKPRKVYAHSILDEQRVARPCILYRMRDACEPGGWHERAQKREDIAPVGFVRVCNKEWPCVKHSEPTHGE